MGISALVFYELFDTTLREQIVCSWFLFGGTVAKHPSAALSPCSLVRRPMRTPPRSLVDALRLGILQQSLGVKLAQKDCFCNE